MPAPLSIRSATGADARPLAALAARTFRDTYRGPDELDGIDDYIARHFTIAAIEALLADPACTTLLAFHDGAPAGYALLRAGPPPACVTGALPIQLDRLYLDAACTGRGHGTTLLAAAVALARDLGAATLWLGVYQRNARAIAFYEKRGFRRVGQRDFPFGGKVFVDPVYAAGLGEIRFPADADRRVEDALP